MSINLLTVPNDYDLFANSITTNTTTDVPIVAQETVMEPLIISGGGTITAFTIRGVTSPLPPVIPVFIQTLAGNAGAFQQNAIKIPKFVITYTGTNPPTFSFSVPVNICPANGNTIAWAVTLIDGGVLKSGVAQMAASGGVGVVQCNLNVGSFSGPMIGLANDTCFVYDPLL